MKARKAIALGVTVGIATGMLVGSIIVAIQRAVDDEHTALRRNETPGTSVVRSEAYPGDPAQEARLVETEGERLVYVRTVAATARWADPATASAPYRVATGTTVTLVLPPRPEPYTVDDLRALAPDSFVQQPDGSYLLSESIAVLTGAELTLDQERGLTLHLRSDAGAFVSIVALGGKLTMRGTAYAPVTVSSLDPATGEPDLTTEDGRAYVRVIGGTATLSHSRFSDLGFWSGNTAGLALTGTEDAEEFSPTPETPDAAAGATAASPGPVAPPEAAAGASPGAAAGAQLLPPGATATPGPDGDAAFSHVTAALDHVSVSGNAFGLFVTSAEGLTVRDSSFRDNLVDGVVLHRFVSDSSIIRTSATGNAADGFTVGRSSGDVRFDRVVARDNGRNGLTLNGRALAEGPSASGTAVETYGGNRVRHSTIEGNDRYGVEVSGGSDVSVSSTRFENNAIGVVLNHAAEHVDVRDNTLDAQTWQAIAVRDGVADTTIARNAISGGQTGVYLRNAQAAVTGSEISGGARHGVSLVGDVTGASITNNTISGSGAVAVWNERATGGTIADNDESGWQPAPTMAAFINALFQPLTVIWILLGALLVGTSLTRRGGQYASIRHPYAERVPLTSLSRGIVSPESLGERGKDGAG